MNIALVTLGIYPVTTGGVEVHSFNQALKLAARQHKVSVYTKKQTRSLSRIMIEGVSIRILGSTLPIIGPLLFTIETALNLIRERKSIDLVHVHYATYFLFPAYVFNLLTKKPFVVTCHGYDVLFLGANLFWKSFQRGMLSMASGITTPSRALKESLVVDYRLQSGKIVVVPNGVDLDEIQRAKTAPKVSGRRRVVLVANLRPVKDPLTAVKAFEIVARQVEKSDLVIVGDGSLRQKVQAHIKGHGISSRVAMKGSMSHADVLREIWQSDCLILSSISEGGTPLAVLEAMALGKPVVATAVGGVNDIIVNRVNGLLVPPSSPEALARGIIEVLLNEDLAKSISLGATAAVQSYTWERSITAYEQIYESLSSDKHTAPVTQKS